MKIKICGITNIDDAMLCARLGVDALGFIFYKKSKRYIDPYAAKSIISELPPFLTKVGVFVNENPDFINKTAKEIKLNSVQLHGDESVEILKDISFPIVKAFRISDSFDFNTLEKYKETFFLLDSFHPHEYGGSGLKFNWNKIPNNIKSKIILAGGVSLENIEFIFNQIKPYAVDISSSIELEPGKKDHNKVKLLFEKFNDLRNKNVNSSKS